MTRKVLADPIVSLWVSVALVLIGLSVILWQQQRLDRHVSSLEAQMRTSQSDRSEMRTQIKAVEDAQ